MGADIPIANAQQHGWKMISLHDAYEKQVCSVFMCVNVLKYVEYVCVCVYSYMCVCGDMVCG